MSFSNILWFAILAALSYAVAPVSLVRGWFLLRQQPQTLTVAPILSLFGFMLATLSAVLAIGTIAFAQVHHFPYYDPTLLRVFRWGLLLSTSAFFFGIAGIWRKSSLRWHAPISGFATFAFWVLAAAME